MSKRSVKKDLPKKVFYVRLSADKKTAKNKGDDRSPEDVEFENQLIEMRHLWPEPDEIHTEKKSGGDPLKVLFRLVTKLPPRSIIYGIHIDRLTRIGPFHLGFIIEIARQRKITIITKEEGELTKMTAMQEIMASMKAYAAAEERAATSRRIKAKIEARKEMGLKWGFELARENGNWKPGVRPQNPLWEKARPRLTELRKQGYTIRELSALSVSEFGERISVTQVQRIVGDVEVERKWRSQKRGKARA